MRVCKNCKWWLKSGRGDVGNCHVKSRNNRKLKVTTSDDHCDEIKNVITSSPEDGIEGFTYWFEEKPE